jgi:hypothetical protein
MESRMIGDEVTKGKQDPRDAFVKGANVLWKKRLPSEEPPAKLKLKF